MFAINLHNTLLHILMLFKANSSILYDMKCYPIMKDIIHCLIRIRDVVATL